MRLASFLSCLKSNPQRTRRDRGQRTKRHRRLGFTPRTVPSTFMVENLADSGPGSLRQAVLDANFQPGADRILFTGQAHGTITLGRQLDVNDDLEIRGPGAELVAVNGNGDSRVFEISRGVTAVLAGLTITHGHAEDGGGIYNSGTLTVTHCTLSANQALGGEGGHARGGAIFNDAGALLAVTHSVLSGNQVVGGDGGPGVPGGEGAGGGIYNLDATLTVSNSTFIGNQAFGGDGGLGAGGGIANGGALASEGINGPAFLSISHSTLSANRATGGAGGMVTTTEDSDGHGGAVFNRGWTTLFLSHSTVSDNAATGGAGYAGRVGGNGNGGGLLLSITAAGPTVIHISSCDFTGNQATGGAGGAGASGGVGQAGAIRTSARGTSSFLGSFLVSHSTFSGNLATGGAGGAGANGGLGQGGAYQTIGANWTITISRSTFSGNQATGGAGGNGGNGGVGRGGGCIFNNSTVSLEYVDITGNQATGGAAGAGGQDGQGIGGGIYINSGLVSARHTNITGNHASTSDDDVFGLLNLGG